MNDSQEDSDPFENSEAADVDTERKKRKIKVRPTESTVRFEDDKEKDLFSIRFDSRLERMKERESRPSFSRSNYSVLKGSVDDRKFKSMEERQKWIREEEAKDEF